MSLVVEQNVDAKVVERQSPRAIAIVCNSLPPYRVHVHERIVYEMPEVVLWTICTHETTGDRWSFAPPPEIRPVSFGSGETVLRQGSLRFALAEWQKGGRVIKWLIENDVRAVVMLGYNDPGRMRIINWCEKNDVPCFLWGDSNIRGDLARGWKALLKRLVVGRIIRACAGLLPCGELGAQYFAKYGGDMKRMFYHPVEPDYEMIIQLSQSRIDEVKSHYKLRDGRRRIIFSGRLIEVKRPDLIIQAFIDIAKRRPDWDLIMAGEGVLRKQLQDSVPADQRERVLWTGFIDDQPAVSALYRLSDVMVLPSDYEPWGLVVNEAATAGLALVCADAVGAAKELVRDGVNGRVFPAGNLAALTDALLEVTLPEKIDAMKSASAQVVRRWREVADPIDGLRRALRFCHVLPEAGSQCR